MQLHLQTEMGAPERGALAVGEKTGRRGGGLPWSEIRKGMRGMAEGIKTTCAGFLSSRKGAAPAEAQKKEERHLQPDSIFSHQKRITHCAPIRK